MEFESKRDCFEIPEGVIYLDGNSLGPLARGVGHAVDKVVHHEWRDGLIRSWNQHGWIDMPERVGNRLAGLIGAAQDTVTLCDTLSLNVVKALSAALQLNPERRVILSDTGNFPSDLYMAQGLIKSLGAEYRLEAVEPEDVAQRIDDDIAVVMLTHVDYRTGRMHDMAEITRITHEKGAVSFWDLAHSAGALPVDLNGCGVDLAAGCTYKYLNGGPGAPGFIYVRPELIDRISPLLSGWLGHQNPFDFVPDYEPAKGIRRMRVGTPPVIALAALDAALDVFDDVDMQQIRAQSLLLGDLFIEQMAPLCREFGFSLSSPRDAATRGSQVSFRHEHGFAIMQALIADGVIGDFRAPDNLRFGFAPLYISTDDVSCAVDRLNRIMREETYKSTEFNKRGQVT